MITIWWDALSLYKTSGSYKSPRSQIQGITQITEKSLKFEGDAWEGKYRKKMWL